MPHCKSLTVLTHAVIPDAHNCYITDVPCGAASQLPGQKVNTPSAFESAESGKMTMAVTTPPLPIDRSPSAAVKQTPCRQSTTPVVKGVQWLGPNFRLLALSINFRRCVILFTS